MIQSVLALSLIFTAISSRAHPNDSSLSKKRPQLTLEIRRACERKLLAAERVQSEFDLRWDQMNPATTAMNQVFGISYREIAPPAFFMPTPSNSRGETSDVQCFRNGWVCEHRWPMIANMVEFRNVTQSEFKVTNWWTNGANQIAFGRGRLGFIVINNEDQPLDVALSTGMEPGTYCKILAEGGACSTKVTIADDGHGRFQVGARSAVAIHVGKRP